MENKEIFDLCNQFSKKENVEFDFISKENESTTAEKYEIKNIELNSSSKLIVSVLENGVKGEVVIYKFSKKDIEKAIKDAKKIAKSKKVETKIKEFGKSISKYKPKIDKNLKELEIKHIIPEVKKHLKKDKYITSILFEANKTNLYRFYINPYTNNEINKNYLNTVAYFNTKYKKPSSNHYSQIYTKEKDININELFKQAKVNAYNTLNPKKSKKGVYTLILTPEMSKELLDNFMLDGIDGKLIKEEQSYLYKDYKKTNFSKSLNIKEDPKLDYFLRSKDIDSEGFKTSKKDIFKDGVFKKYIFDQYNANKYNEKPTGNAEGLTNIIVENGREKINNYIQKTKNGILVYEILGFHTNSIARDSFNLTISLAKKIDNGEFKDTLKNITFSGSKREILNKIKFLKEQKFFGSSLYPFAVIKDVKLI